MLKMLTDIRDDFAKIVCTDDDPESFISIDVTPEELELIVRSLTESIQIRRNQQVPLCELPTNTRLTINGATGSLVNLVNDGFPIFLSGDDGLFHGVGDITRRDYILQDE